MASSRAYKSPAWAALRLAVLHAAGYRCHYCGGPATEADHVVALAEGGALLDRRNLVAACRSCNARRGGQLRVARGRRIGQRSRRW